MSDGSPLCLQEFIDFLSQEYAWLYQLNYRQTRPLARQNSMTGLEPNPVGNKRILLYSASKMDNSSPH